MQRSLPARLAFASLVTVAHCASAQVPGVRPDPYAPQYQQPSGNRSQIGLPPVPQLTAPQYTPAATPPAAPAVATPTNTPPSYYAQAAAAAAQNASAAAPGRYPLPGQQPPAQPAVQPTQPPPTAGAPPIIPPPTAAPAATVPAAVAAADAPPSSELFEPGKIVAIVGNQYILYGDVAPTVNQYMEAMKKKAKSQQDLEQIESAREALTKQIVSTRISDLLMYMEFERVLQKNAKDKIIEARTKFADKIQESFDAKLTEAQDKVVDIGPEKLQEMMRSDAIITQLAMTMKENNLQTQRELDNKLRETGSSLAKQRMAWGQYQAGRSTLGDRVRTTAEITHQQMLDYYEKNYEKYHTKARATFELMTVRFDRYPTKPEAFAAIAAMGNEVFFGAPFAAVAKRSSHDPNAAQGGQYGWTNKGSLASTVIDEAIFSLEVGKLSQILEDDKGYHILRVIEREAEGYIPFIEKQKEIKEAITTERRDKAFKDVIADLRNKTPVWSFYETEITAGAKGTAAAIDLSPR